jgi:hypothetical protein
MARLDQTPIVLTRISQNTTLKAVILCLYFITDDIN